MDEKIYKEIVLKNKPKENRLKNSFVAFVTGGTIGIIAEFLIELYSYILDISSKEAGTFMIVTLIFIAALLTSLAVALNNGYHPLLFFSFIFKIILCWLA